MVSLSSLTPNTRGILSINLGVVCYSLSNVCIREIGTSIPAVEMILYRSLLCFFAIVGYCAWRHGRAGVRTIFTTQHLGLNLFRGLMGGIGLVMIFYAFATLPLAEASALNFSSTFFITLLSAPILKETVGWRRWCAVIIGFAGILMIVQPTKADILAHLAVYSIGAALLGALLDSVSMVYNRYLSRYDTVMTLFMYYTLCSLFVSLACCGIMVWGFDQSFTDLTLRQSLLILAISVGGGLGTYFVTSAFSYAEASLIAPFIYILLAWGILFGFIFWGEIPNIETILGGLVVVMVGIFVSRSTPLVKKA